MRPFLKFVEDVNFNKTNNTSFSAPFALSLSHLSFQILLANLASDAESKTVG